MKSKRENPHMIQINLLLTDQNKNKQPISYQPIFIEVQRDLIINKGKKLSYRENKILLNFNNT
jgi:hypothetical protein